MEKLRKQPKVNAAGIKIKSLMITYCNSSLTGGGKAATVDRDILKGKSKKATKKPSKKK
jgi:hypothetical protein